MRGDHEGEAVIDLRARHIVPATNLVAGALLVLGTVGSVKRCVSENKR